MRFRSRYPLSLQELLLAPVIFRDTSAELEDLPLASAAGMRDLATYGGHRPGAIRTALSRLRADKAIEPVPGRDGVIRYRMGALSRSISRAVQARFQRPSGFAVAVFSFATEHARGRQVMRSLLAHHGFQKLAQNVYINGQLDTAEMEKMIRRQGLSEHLFLFRCQDAEDKALRRKLARIFDLTGRARALARFEADLRAFLEEPGLPGDEIARRCFYSGPVHYRVTFAEEPPLPASCFPADYPLERLSNYLPAALQKHARELVGYFRKVNV